MPDIIDNRGEKLADRIRTMLASSQAAHFAVGYFFVSGLDSLADRLGDVRELRLLIGNTSNQETIEQLAEGYRRLDLVADELDAQAYPQRGRMRQMVQATGQNVRDALAAMDQTDAAQATVQTLVRMIEERRLKVRVYTRGRLHAKAYIFDYGPVYNAAGQPVPRAEVGTAVVGSSNLTLSGVTHNTELNVVVTGNDNHASLTRWFDELWDEAQDFDATLMQEMRQSWAVAPVRPYDIYLKTLYTLVRDRVEGDRDAEPLWTDAITDRLADFQRNAVKQAVRIIRDQGGVFVADVVGLGKSYIGAAIVKHFEQTERARPLIICPAPLFDMWERYNEVYHLNARVLSMGYLHENGHAPGRTILNEVIYRDRDFVLVDESHNFRNTDTQRYRILQEFLAHGKRACFLTATPRNKSAWDIFNQIKLFHQDDITELPVDPPNLRQYFKLVEEGQRRLPDLLSHILIRRTRNHILRFYGYDAETHERVDQWRFAEYLNGTRRAYVQVDGRHQFFPRRELETVEYSIEDAYQGLYQQLRAFLGRARDGGLDTPVPGELTFARYGLWHYVHRAKRTQEPYKGLQKAGRNLRGLVRVLLFKRFESSVYAFQQTVGRLLRVHQKFIAALDQGIVPAGTDAQELLYESDRYEDDELMELLLPLADKYSIRDFDVPHLRAHILHDIQVLEQMLALVAPIPPARDAKLQTLQRLLDRPRLRTAKRLIFTEYADTARYLFDNLNPNGAHADMDVIYSGDKSKARAVGRFAPRSNPEYPRRPEDVELNTLIATDVLSEGLNLQDCDTIINYDLHWNPVRLIQRFGRIDRIGSEHDVVYGFNFLPETGLERNLGLREKLHNRIQEIHDTIGEDAQILDRSEQLNEDALYAIYEQRGGQLSLFEEDAALALDDLLDLNEAEEIMRQLKESNPAEYQRIADLRDGIRTARRSPTPGLYVLCQAGDYRQLFLVDGQGQVVTRDIPHILTLLQCPPTEIALPVPPDYNAAVMRVRRLFAEEVKHRLAEQRHTLALRVGQRYVLDELRVLLAATQDEDEKAVIHQLEGVFRGSLTLAVHRELSQLRRSGLTGRALLTQLRQIYIQHNLRDTRDSRAGRTNDNPLVQVICSEALL